MSAVKGLIEENPDYSREFFEKASEYVDLVTITREGSASILNSLSYQELTGDAPRFRENEELLSPEIIQVLDSWPQNTMYPSNENG